MLRLQIPDSTAHIPDDILSLPVFAESLREEVVGSIDDMKWSEIGSLESSLIEWDQ